MDLTYTTEKFWSLGGRTTGSKYKHWSLTTSTSLLVNESIKFEKWVVGDYMVVSISKDNSALRK